MSENPRIPPALTAEEWTDVLADIASDELPFTAHIEGLSDAGQIAVLNHLMRPDDPRKITRTWVIWLREEADVLRRNGARAGALMADEIADALESYLQPDQNRP